MPPGLVSETLPPWRSSAVRRFSRALAISSPKASRNCGEGQPARVADDRDHQRAPAVLALDVDRDAEVARAVVDHVRLAVDLVEVARHHRHLLRGRARDRVGDQVGEGDLVAGLLELLAPRVERRDRDRAEGGRGRDGARLVHVAGEHRRGALDELGAGGLRRGGRRGAVAVAARRRSRRRARRPCRSGRPGRCPGRARGRCRARRRRGGRPGWPSSRRAAPTAAPASVAGRGALVGLRRAATPPARPRRRRRSGR